MEENQAAAALDTNQIIEERRAKLQALRKAGTPFPNDYVRRDLAGDVSARYGSADRESLES
ncbi:MAG TPA: lysine--tRNA ligase, partial [Burkholderiales bacterium]|nr:lysine--tRNA ligase [Burkholderiales bacterium]